VAAQVTASQEGLSSMSDIFQLGNYKEISHIIFSQYFSRVVTRKLVLHYFQSILQPASYKEIIFTLLTLKTLLYEGANGMKPLVTENVTIVSVTVHRSYHGNRITAGSKFM
jgi:hypothetical protein